MINITIDDNKQKQISISLNKDEWEFIKEHLLENSLDFHAASYNEFKEFASDLVDENFDPLKNIPIFQKYKSTIEKLKSIDVKTFNLEKI